MNIVKVFFSEFVGAKLRSLDFLFVMDLGGKSGWSHLREPQKPNFTWSIQENLHSTWRRIEWNIRPVSQSSWVIRIRDPRKLCVTRHKQWRKFTRDIIGALQHELYDVIDSWSFSGFCSKWTCVLKNVQRNLMELVSLQFMGLEALN